MRPASSSGIGLSEAERALRKRYLAATVITCIALAMIGGAAHVVKLGANRLADMRDRATYNLNEESERIRAAGEDITRHALHEAGAVRAGFSREQVEDLLTPEQWQALESVIEIPAGTFIVGTNREGTDPQNRPERKVALAAYRIDKYPVTIAQYARFVAATGHAPPLDWEKGEIPKNRLFHPVTMVSWFDAAAYAEWAKKRLPTELEWEKAARGTDGRRWPWGDTIDPARLNTYYSVGSTTPVTDYPNGASVFGAMDMAGNVTEWTADNFAPYPGSDASPDIFKVKFATPATPEDRQKKVVDLKVVDNISYRVLRGGSWKSDPFSTATYHRNFALPNYASDFYGFRCASDVESKP